MKPYLHEQIEKIIDEGRGATRDVIVQMSPESTEYSRLLQASSRAIRKRSMSTSARELLPPPAKILKRKARPKERRTELRTHTQSLASQVAALAKPRRPTPRRAAGLKSLDPLLQSEGVKVAAAKEADKERGKKIRKFWSSSSAAMRLDKDTLKNLPGQVANIAGIYPNRRMKLAPIVEVTPDRLPANVADNKTSAWGLNAIGAMSVWGAYGAEGQDVKVAVLDTGIDADHKDLEDRLRSADWAEFDFDGNRVVDSEPHDSAKHGTHVAGTIAGDVQSGQWIGVAPQAKIAGGLVLKRGEGTDAQILAGIEWAIEKGVDVINMSLGGLRLSPDVFDTYTQAFVSANLAGIPVVVSIGNEGSQTSGSPGNDFCAFAVWATDVEDRAAGFSGGRTQIFLESRVIEQETLPLIYSKPELAAPGVAVKSSVPGNRYAIWNGTSMAAPHVSGAIALLLSATTIGEVDPSERAFLIQDLLISTVEELGESGQDHRYGFGRIDVLKAVGYAWDLGYGF
ncbi:MAG: S8 family serine peptidase [bacterium]|nr:S8 family serine peptidase [bacterium]